MSEIQLNIDGKEVTIEYFDSPVEEKRETITITKT